MYSSKSNRIKSQQQLDRKMIEIVREEEHVTWKKYLIIWSLNLWSKRDNNNRKNNYSHFPWIIKEPIEGTVYEH